MPIPNAMTRDEVRNVDRRAVEEFRMPGILLMENAGRGAAELLIRLGITGPVVLCAGRGNNGGDAFVIARHLENRGYDVRILLLADPKSLRGDAAINYQIVVAAQTPLQTLDLPADADRLAAELQPAEWIVDALLGTGTQGEVREPYKTAVAAINAAQKKVFAVDLPSGLDCDTGEPLGCCVRADHTATFVARKRGFDNPASQAWTGEVHVVDIGVPRILLESR